MAPCNVPLYGEMKEPLLEPLFPDRSGGETLGVQLVRRLRSTIESGALPVGAKMPGTRELAKRLGLGRNTVTLAYEQLIAEGYLEARVGAGTFVCAAPVHHATQRAAAAPKMMYRNDRASALAAHFRLARGRGPLRPGMPSLAEFPRRTWVQCAKRALEVYAGDLGYAPAYGTPELREAVIDHVRRFRGMNVGSDQVIVVEGAQAALHLSAAVLTRPGDSIVVEDPCYALARAAFELAQLRLLPLNVDERGIVTGELRAKARAAFVTPAHQFPLGGTLTLERRLELLEWARRHDAYIIEDDYDSEFTNRSRPLPALQSLDRDGRVVYVGSFSKTLAPALRAGYMIVPPYLVTAFRLARASSSLGVSLHLQQTLALFIRGGHFVRHIGRMNDIYDRRRGLLVAALAPLVSQGFRIGPAEVGLHLTIAAKGRFDDRAASIVDDSQRLVALSPLCVKRKDLRGFVLGFTNGENQGIEAAASEVARRLQARLRRT